MKNNMRSILVMFILIFSATGCKKNDKPVFNPEGTIWTGSYTGGLYSFKLDAGGKLVWHDIAGDRNGTWTYTSGKLALVMSGMSFKADFTAGKELSNIENSPGFTLNSGALIPEALAVVPEKGSKWVSTKGGPVFGGVYVWYFDSPFLDIYDTGGIIKTSANFFTWKDGALYFGYKEANVAKSDIAVLNAKGKLLWRGNGSIELTKAQP
ncbi:hypothetical protein EGT74_16910 [Chitinophaga lutea]|uniref:Uncharacterized protein n=1 Tax=Chitinophaga lutea TaxID=2488634 RepID=A0A3N4PKH9_9BACT|nr:hypothetical protein [Chitinophaga lutea]RPE08716.1 hypothetical protein EGT74_16910 [Chitinophaga lutea]